MRRVRSGRSLPAVRAADSCSPGCRGARAQRPSRDRGRRGKARLSYTPTFSSPQALTATVSFRDAGGERIAAGDHLGAPLGYRPLAPRTGLRWGAWAGLVVVQRVRFENPVLPVRDGSAGGAPTPDVMATMMALILRGLVGSGGMRPVGA